MNITKEMQLFILLVALILGIVGKYEIAIWILLMGIYAYKIDKK